MSQRIATRHSSASQIPAITPAEIMKAHNRVLLHALQTAHPVTYEKKQRFVHTFMCSIRGGTTETTLYLTGDSTPVPADQVTLYEELK